MATVMNAQTPMNIRVADAVESLLRRRRSGLRFGISSPEASRLNPVSNATSAGADAASSSAMRLSERISRSFRLRANLLHHAVPCQGTRCQLILLATSM
jgi:hypothetical protein